MDKKGLRKTMLAMRDLKFSDAASAKICELFLERFNNYKQYAIYVSFSSEVDTKKLIKILLENKKTVLVPKIIDNEM